LQSGGILKLVKNVKLLLVFQNVDLNNLVNFGHWEGHQFKF
jgi:hypothetical protein